MARYEVTVKVAVEGPSRCLRAVEKTVHALAQELLPGDMEGGFEVVGASAEAAREVDGRPASPAGAVR